MAGSGPGTSIIGSGTVHDNFSHLPGEIKDLILTKLPIKDAVRTSLLSTKWRFTWASIPEIVVKDDDFIPTIDTSEPSLHFVRNVDHLLSNLKGPILKFELATKHICPEAFDRWILNLSGNGITHITLVLNFASRFIYRIPSNFFFCDALQYVVLSRCWIELPHGFEGFKLLRNLTLKKCTISAAHIERLVSSSPKLVYLVLNFFKVKDNLRIFSKELRFLAVWGVFPDIQIDAPNLFALTIGCSGSKNSPAGVKCIYNFCLSLGGLVKIRHIGFLAFSVLYLVDRSPKVLLNSCLKKFTSIALDVDLANQKECRFMLSLLQNATRLQNLNLIVRRSENTTGLSLWEEKAIVFKSIRRVVVRTCKASEPILAVAKFILRSTPNLRKFTLMEDPIYPKEGNRDIFKQVLKFQRASNRADIIFE